MSKQAAQSKDDNVIFGERFTSKLRVKEGSSGITRSGITRTVSNIDCGGFDYSSVPSSVATFLRTQADRINQTSSKSLLQIGKDLIAAKRYLAHGAFIAWVEYEAGMSARTAQAYMHVANWAARKNSAVTRLAPSILYIISARSVPEEFIEKLLQRMESGEKITARDVRQEIASLRGGANNKNHSGERTESPGSMPDQSLLSVSDAICILVGGLSRSDFVRVKAIMTNRAVLGDPKLAEKIVKAFTSVDESVAIEDRPSSDNVGLTRYFENEASGSPRGRVRAACS
jgi:Protein of unknown function (DUF3102)